MDFGWEWWHFAYFVQPVICKLVCGKTSSSAVSLVVVAMWVGSILARYAPLPQESNGPRRRRECVYFPRESGEEDNGSWVVIDSEFQRGRSLLDANTPQLLKLL
ncbi:hypothetical protein F0562_016559 [Nyssa sinensis]|uniref:Uncharacterized protein n=1 Tax=Nyssa sinensis TaxID=561372 RepID=A0A5J4ZET6_9ASTE|nr:hypothetical protein F0562_016559 [Nyssa sinensis]